jgi:hypothetical protein
MLTFDQIKALDIGADINYTPHSSDVSVAGTVIKNGPNFDSSGNPISYMPSVLIVRLGAGPMQISWGYDGLGGGLPELALPS